MKFSEIHRVAIYRPGNLGDTVIALPSYHLIRLSFPRAKITLLTPRPVNATAAPAASILDGTGLVDDYISYPIPLRGVRRIAALRGEIAARKFQCLVYLAHHRKGVALGLWQSLFFASCGIRRLVGVPTRRRDLECVADPRTGRFRPESDRLVSCLRRLGRPDLSEPGWWDLHISDGEQRVADDLLAEAGVTQPFLAFGLGTAIQVNDWTEANWLALADRLRADHPGLALVAIGSKVDRARSANVLGRWNGPTLNACGEIPPRVSAAVLRRAAVYVGHDSGTMHLANSVGTPCVAIFSARERPGEWWPRGPQNRVIFHKTECSPCFLTTCVTNGKKCILSITTGEVAEAVSECLTCRQSLV